MSAFYYKYPRPLVVNHNRQMWMIYALNYYCHTNTIHPLNTNIIICRALSIAIWNWTTCCWIMKVTLSSPITACARKAFGQAIQLLHSAALPITLRQKFFVAKTMVSDVTYNILPFHLFGRYYFKIKTSKIYPHRILGRLVGLGCIAIWNVGRSQPVWYCWSIWESGSGKMGHI